MKINVFQMKNINKKNQPNNIIKNSVFYCLQDQWKFHKGQMC